MARQRVVAISYQANDDYAAINAEVLGRDADLVYTHRVPEGERAALLATADAVIGWNPPRELPAGAVEQAGRLRFLQLLSAGADGLDFRAIPESVQVAGNVGAYSEPIAEHVMAMTLALARRLPQRHADLAAGNFDQAARLITLNGAVCAILGFGGIGQATAALMRAFGARIYAVNSTGHVDEPVDFAGTLADLDEVLIAADVLVISLPLTVATRGLIGARELSLMKPAAIVVNVARGAIVQERALYRHLAENPQFCAGIDAWWHEPRAGAGFRTGFPFLDLPNVIGSPHNSGVVPGVLRQAARKAAGNVLRFLRSEPVTGLMNSRDYL